jgi:hypothetical protein
VVGLLLATVAMSTGLAAGAGPTSTTAPAGAKPQHKQQPTELWALSPTATDPHEVGNRSTLTYSLTKGADQTDRLTVWNYGSTAAPFRLYATDAFDSAEGQLALLRGDQKPVDIGRWVELPVSSVIVPPGSAEVVPVYVHVPKTATPGDHAGGVVAQIETPATDAQGRAVDVVHRIAVPLYVRVAGKLDPRLAISPISSQYHRSAAAVSGGTLDVTYTVRNVGNVRLSAHERASVSGPFGLAGRHQTLRDVPELLPGAHVTLHARFTGVLPLLRLTTTVKLQPYSRSGPVSPAPASVSASTSVWAIAWLWILAFLVVAGLLYLRYRRRHAAPAASPPPAPRELADATT